MHCKGTQSIDAAALVAATWLLLEVVISNPMVPSCSGYSGIQKRMALWNQNADK